MTTPYSPIFVQPSAPGSLSNKLGTNLTTDQLTFIAKYGNPQGASEGPAAFRYKAWRTPLGSTTPILAEDSFWLGTGNTQPYVSTPAGFPSTVLPVLPNASFTYNGRIYVFTQDVIGSNTVLPKSWNFSAPINGRNIGAWREELPLPANFAMQQPSGPNVFGACVVNGY